MVGCVVYAGNPCYEKAAVEALTQLWGMRTPLDLVGSSIDMTTGSWNNRLGGTGAGADSFYEYLLKAYVLFGKSDTTLTACSETVVALHQPCYLVICNTCTICLCHVQIMCCRTVKLLLVLLMLLPRLQHTYMPGNHISPGHVACERVRFHCQQIPPKHQHRC